MSKKDNAIAIAMLVLYGLFLMAFGYIFGYTHVITSSQAAAIENGDILVLTVDGHDFEYVVSPEFYRTRMFTP